MAVNSEITNKTEINYLQHRKVVIDEQTQEDARYNKELNSERVVVMIVCGAELQVHQIQSSER